MQNLSAAQQVRNELKTKFGITSRDVSVREENCGYSRSLRVRIKNPKARLLEIKEIATKHERVRYCQYSGEILSGGNFYIDVSVDEKAIDYLTSIHAEKLNLEQLLKEAQELPVDQFIEINGIKGAMIGKHRNSPITLSLFIYSDKISNVQTYVYCVKDVIGSLYRAGAI